MDENQHAQFHINEKLQQLAAARQLLGATKMSLQLVDEHIAQLEREDVPLQLASDISSEHRVWWCGAVDDLDGLDGIAIMKAGVTPTAGWGNPKGGMCRNQADAAFVVTDVMICQQRFQADGSAVLQEGFDAGSNGVQDASQIYIRLTDLNTGRALITGSTVGPFDRDRGAVPLSYISSSRAGSGPTFKNSLFSEFTLPRAAVVKVELFNLADINAGFPDSDLRAFVSLYGYRVLGG